MRRSPLIVGHRGDSAHAPENTLAAFHTAIEAGADGIEFDVRISKDGVPVIIHDPDLGRTGCRPESVSSLTARELASIDVGSWFNRRFPKLAQPSFAGQTVPTLAQVLNSLTDYDGLVYIELKAGKTGQRELVQAVCDVIHDSPLLKQVVVKSFKLGMIPIVRQTVPEVQTAALFEPVILDFLRRRKYLIDLANELGAHQLSLHHRLVTRKLTALAEAAKMPLTVWTVDDRKWLQRAQKLNIGAIITNDPGKMLLGRNSKYGHATEST